MAELNDESRKVISCIMTRYGARSTPEEFHSAVNVTFHNFESQVYDEIHADMWRSLPQQFCLLVDDCIRKYPNAPSQMRVLDIGAGTGLASDCLLRTAFGPRVTSIDLVDTSPSMLKQAARRASKWNVPMRSRLGLVSEVPDGEQYELIVTCSVLHHVPDVEAFCRQVRRLQAPGGVFLHLQDPNSEYLERNPPESGRKRRLLEQIRRFTPARILGRVSRELKGTQGEDYISKTNRSLVESGIIARPLKTADLFAVTDIQEHNGHGISIDAMKQWLPDHECISRRSYAFFGNLASELPAEMRSQEELWCKQDRVDGLEVAAGWRLRIA